MADDLMLEVTGSSTKAQNALQKVIIAITNLQKTFEQATPALTEFSKKMESLASSSKAVATFNNITNATNKQTLAAKDAESKMAMYQARLDRATVSSARSRQQLEKLAAAHKKAAEAAAIDAKNEAAFSMSAQEFKAKFDVNKNEKATNINPQVSRSVPLEPTKLASEILQDQSPSIKVNTSSIESAAEKAGKLIDSLAPHVSRMSAETQAQFDNLAGKFMNLSLQIDNQRALYQKLAESAEKVASINGKNSEKYLRLEKRLLSADNAIQRLIERQEKLKAEMSSLAGVSKKAGLALLLFGNRASSTSKKSSELRKTARMMKSMFIRIAAFRLFSAGQQGVTEGIQNLAQASSKANQSMSALSTNFLYLKNSLATAIMPIIEALTPAITWLTDKIANLFNMIGMLFARIFNGSKTVTIAKKATVDYAATLNSTSKAAEAAKKSIMGFDELHILQEQSSTSATNTGMPEPTMMFETVQVPPVVEKIGQTTDKIKQFIEDNMKDIKRILFASSLALGAVLAFSGANIPLGLGLMAVGAYGLAKQAKEDWNYLSDNTNNSLDKLKKVMTLVGATEIAVGAALAFSGAATGLGIALMIGGITTTAPNLNWHSMGDKVSDSVKEISFETGQAMLALGAVFAFSGAATKLGIGLMIAGLTTTASVMLDWNNMSEKVKTQLSKIMLMFGIFDIAVGLILALSGPATAPGGIALIAVGVANLVGVATLNWDYITKNVGSEFNKIKGFLSFVGITLAIFGVILMLAGPATAPFGVKALIGGLGLTALTIDWNYLGNKLKEAWNNIKSWYHEKVAPWFTAEKWKGLAQNAINGLLAPFKNIQWPHISTPHISWKPGGWEASGWIKDVLSALNLPTTLPKLSVEWYAKGGVFTAPTIAGIGEAGPEAVLPLNQDTYHSIAEGIVENGGGNYDTEKIISALESLKQAILNRPIKLYADNREIARAANAGNQSINRRYRTIASS